MNTVEYVGGPVDGLVVDTPLILNACREVVQQGHVYGCLDVYDSRDVLYLLYGHIEQADASA